MSILYVGCDKKNKISSVIKYGWVFAEYVTFYRLFLINNFRYNGVRYFVLLLISVENIALKLLTWVSNACSSKALLEQG